MKNTNNFTDCNIYWHLFCNKILSKSESLMSSSHKKLSLFQYSYINHSFSKKDMYVAFKKENVKKKIL